LGVHADIITAVTDTPRRRSPNSHQQTDMVPAMYKNLCGHIFLGAGTMLGPREIHLPGFQVYFNSREKEKTKDIIKKSFFYSRPYYYSRVIPED